MPQYTVKSGDNLTKIASNLGLPSYKSLSGYNTSNPNLITPGMVLSWGNPAPAAPAPAPASAPNYPSDNSDLTAFANQQKSEMDALLNSQKAEQAGLFGKYETAIGGQEKLGEAYTRLQNESGVPDLQGQLDIFKTQIYGVKDLIDKLEENVNSRISGSFTNEAQRNRQIAYEANPLNTQLSRLGTGMAPIVDRLNSATADVSNRLNFLSQDQAKALKPLEMQINAVSDRFAREITGFTTSKQTQLDALLDKITRGRELADREWQLTQTLAAEEREFQRQKELAKISASAQTSGLSSNPYLQNMMNSMTAQTSTPMASASRAGKTDNISYGGKSYTRENFASIIANTTDRNSAQWQSVYKQVLSEFPDYAKTLSGGYTSPTSLFGMG